MNGSIKERVKEATKRRRTWHASLHDTTFQGFFLPSQTESSEGPAISEVPLRPMVSPVLLARHRSSSLSAQLFSEVRSEPSCEKTINSHRTSIIEAEKRDHQPYTAERASVSEWPVVDGRAEGTILPPASAAWETDLRMMYIDFVFPFLFPFYRPSLLGTGRGWLLSVTEKNNAMLNSVVSLSAFFFTVCRSDTATINPLSPNQPSRCRSYVWKQIKGRVEKSFDLLRADISRLESLSTPGVLLKTEVMGEIIQLLIFNQFIGGYEDWQSHLIMAIDIFKGLYEESSSLAASEQGLTKRGLGCILERINSPGPQVIGFERTLWNPHQAGFRFFTAVLLYFDILASTTLKQAPRLHSLHSHLLGEITLYETGGPINLLHFFGCQNRILRAIGDTSALTAWKQQSDQEHSLSQMDLVERSQTIFKDLQDTFKNLDEEDQIPVSDTPRIRTYNQLYGNITGCCSNKPTRIWAHAARIYLTSVVFGWKSHDKQVLHDASQVVNLLQSIELVAELRTFIWPISIVGCIIEPSPSLDRLYSIIAQSSESQLLDAVQKAKEIIEWSKKPDNQKSRDFDFASCFNSSGVPVLLF